MRSLTSTATHINQYSSTTTIISRYVCTPFLPFASFSVL
jgi:hypothetical protein